jgi:3-dehydroquinate synthase
MSISPILVSFKSAVHADRSHGAYKWLPGNLASDFTSSPIEGELGWPQGTIAILNHAFENRLTRFTAWDTSGIRDPSQKKALKCAASVYKRGVCVFDAADSLAHDAPAVHGSYQIEFGGQDETITSLFEHVDSKKTFIIADSNVARSWSLESILGDVVAVVCSEDNKSLKTVGHILKLWEDAGKKKEWLIIGGGILGDIAAFCASLCGAPFILVPTTLLAMADACIGGKTGVSFPPYGKNQLGHFAFPSKVMIWTKWLESLDDRQLHAGAAECLKHFFLSGDISRMEQFVRAIGVKDYASLSQLLPKIVKIKADIISEDPDERGKRAVLNLGHTLAHALEAVSAASHPASGGILHGEAVAVGLVFAGVLSKIVAGLSDQDCLTIVKTLQNARCLISQSNLMDYLGVTTLDDSELFTRLYKYIQFDKKNYVANEQISRWVLLKKLGLIAQDEKKDYTIEVKFEHIALAWTELVEILKKEV